MQTGQLDMRVSFRRRTVTQDEIGADIPGTPTTVGTFWANVAYLQGRELEVAQQRWAEARYKITIRRQTGITIRPTDYAVWNGQTLDIIPVDGPGTRVDFWTIYAKDHIETGSGVLFDDLQGPFDSLEGDFDSLAVGE